MNGAADTRTADALVVAFCGAFISAVPRLKAQFPEIVDDDPNGSLVSTEAMAQAEREALRLPGIRDIWVVGHPDVTRLQSRLDADRAHIPVPDPVIVEGLSAFEGFAIDGRVISIAGVPVPAGRRQVDYFMVQRYFGLYSPRSLPHLAYCRDPAPVEPADHAALRIGKHEKPSLIHLIDYDARHVTDDVQRSLLTYSTAIHRDNIVALQATNLPLFVALWRRDMATAKMLARLTRQRMLPPSNPKSRIRSHAKRLLIGTSLMNEYERLFEVLDATGAHNLVSRQSIDALFATTALTPVQPVNTKTATFVAGAVAHILGRSDDHASDRRVAPALSVRR